MTTDGWEPPPGRPRGVPPRRLLWVAAPLVAVFAVAGFVIELIDSSRQSGPAAVIGMLLIFGPITGFILLLAPAAILANSRASRIWIIAAEVVIAALVVVVLIFVSTDEHSTAGVALMYIPLVGSAIAGAVAFGSSAVRR